MNVTCYIAISYGTTGTSPVVTISVIIRNLVVSLIPTGTSPVEYSYPDKMTENLFYGVVIVIL